MAHANLLVCGVSCLAMGCAPPPGPTPGSGGRSPRTLIVQSHETWPLTYSLVSKPRDGDNLLREIGKKIRGGGVLRILMYDETTRGDPTVWRGLRDLADRHNLSIWANDIRGSALPHEKVERQVYPPDSK